MLDTIIRLESNVRGYVRTFPTVFDTAKGALLTGKNGRSYIDFFAGAGTLNYGHNNELAKEALLDYIARDGIQHGLDTATTAKVEFLNKFDDLILRPRGMDYKVQFTGPTGTNSVEAAIKLARKYKQRSHIVAFTNAYHGHSLGSLALTGNEYYHSEFYGSHNNVTHLPYEGFAGPESNSVTLLQKMLDDPGSGLPQPAAIILETIQCEGGINVASSEWLQQVAKICRQRDILLIVDDIQVGNGRTGTFFSFETAGIEPDMICLSKSIGGGLPMSLVLISPDVDAWSPGEHTGTFRGNNLAFVASAALLEYWRTDDLSHTVVEYGRTIESRLKSIADEFRSREFAIRGRGMVWGIDVGYGELATLIVRECFSQGLVIETAGALGNVLKVLPPLTIERELLDAGLQILHTAIRAVIEDSSSQVDERSKPVTPVSSHTPGCQTAETV